MSKPKRQKPVPFKRTGSADNNLKIKMLAIDPRNEGVDRVASMNRGVDHEEGASSTNGGGDVKGKLKSGKVRGKEKKEEPGRSGIMRSIAVDYGFSYFAWDTYSISLEDA
jgi:hypothetical protein